MKAKPGLSLKDHLLKREKVEYLAFQIKNTYLVFKSEEFTKVVLGSFPGLELKGRISHISLLLNKRLTDDYLKTLEIVIKSLPPKLESGKKDNDYGMEY